MSSTALQSNNQYEYRASILVPMYNEEATIVFVLNKIKKALVDIRFEIVVVDDGSTDNSAEQVQTFIHLNPHMNISYIRQENQGKGGAIRTAIKAAGGEILVVQDADMEYDPADIVPLVDIFNDGSTKVVYGSRNLNPAEREHSSIWFYWGGLLVTWVTNWLFGTKLTDEATGYKLFHAEIFEQLSYRRNDFAWEPELTAKILKKKIEIKEAPISYKPRSKSEGKKITWMDGVKAIGVLIVERLKKD